jgi:alkylation response protein AidB-like acyl-CoA dehydrogenase
MFAALSDDQRLLADTAARIVADAEAADPRSMPVLDSGDTGWARLAGTGLLGLHLPETAGGGGAHSSDVALVVEQFGRHTSMLPYLGQGVLAPELARAGQASDQFLAKIADGSARITVALSSDLCRLARVGEQAVGWDARGATHGLVLTADDRVALVALADDSQPQADLTRTVRSVPFGAPEEPVGPRLTADDLARTESFMLAALGADLVGVMQAALDAAVRHVSSRVQFGVPVGSFQAVQHLAADAKVLLEGSRSAMWHAAWAADELDPQEALLAARQFKAYVSAAALDVVEIQTQLFGGIAMTWEERAHVRVRRVLLDRLVLGDENAQLDVIAEARLGRTA